MRLTLVTGNPHKLEEIAVALSAHEVVQENLGYPEIQASNLEGVVRDGLGHLVGKVEEPFLIDDSGLFVDALGGFPGVFSKYAFGTLGNPGILKLLEGVEDRSARFECVFGLRYHGEDHIVAGRCPGRIISVEKGGEGFGFDPIFVPDGRDETFAQLPMVEKNHLSHRGRAVKELATLIEKLA